MVAEEPIKSQPVVETGPANAIAAEEESSSDESGNEMNGYQLIGQGSMQVLWDDDEDDSEQAHTEQGPPEHETDTVTGPAPTFGDPESIPNDAEHLNKVAEAMKNISLPGVPTWADSVPEDDWKEFLIARLQSRH